MTFAAAVNKIIVCGPISICQRHGMRDQIDVTLAMDGRMLEREGSGIATYARSLWKAQKELCNSPVRIVDESCKGNPASVSLLQRIGRWAKAATCHSSLALSSDRQANDAFFHATDIFRLAHVRFHQTGNLLSLRAPEPSGIVHWSLPLPIRIEGWLNLYTVHDVIPLLYPQLSAMNGKRHAKLLARIIESADHIVTVSEQSRIDICTVTGCVSDKISNCGIAVQPIKPDSAILPYNLRAGEFFLFIGSDDPRKNVTRLVQAYRQTSTMPLLLVGPHEAFADAQSGIFCLPSRQSAPYLSTLIAQARALLLPSLAEGFGLPVAEAMALGTATLGANRSAMAEVANGASLAVSPESTAEIADGIQRLNDDDELVARLVHLGHERVRAFSFEDFANRLCTLYGALLPRLAEKR